MWLDAGPAKKKTLEVRAMKKAGVLFVGTLAALLAAGPGFAQTTSGTAKDPSTMSTPAPKPGMLSMPHRVTGQVVAADVNDNSMTVRDSKGKEYMFKADADAALKLSTLKEGDHVKVVYKKSHGQMIATKITES